MKWVHKKTFKRCLAITMVLALLGPVNVTSGVFAAVEDKDVAAREDGEDNFLTAEEQVWMEGAGHIHSFACYEGYELNCTEEEEDHIHSLACYTYPEGAELVCGLEEGEEHSHNEDGFQCTETLVRVLACQKEEHEHSEECYEEDEKNPEGSATPTVEPSASATPTVSPSASQTPSIEPTASESPTPESSEEPSQTPVVDDTESTPEPVPEQTPDSTPDTSDKTETGSEDVDKPTDSGNTGSSSDSSGDSSTEESGKDDTDSGNDGNDNTDTDADTDVDGDKDTDADGNAAADENTGDDSNNDADHEDAAGEDSRNAVTELLMDGLVPLSEIPKAVTAEDDDISNNDTSNNDASDNDTVHESDDNTTESEEDIESGEDAGSGDESDSEDDGVLEGEDTSDENSEPICGLEEHTHGDECYVVVYACRKTEEEEAEITYAWNWADEKAQELESVPAADPDLHTGEYDSSKEWTMTLLEPKQRMTLSLLEEDYLPEQIEAVRIETLGDGEDAEVHETKEIMNVTWEVEKGELGGAIKEGNIVTLKAVRADGAVNQAALDADADMEDTENSESEDVENADSEDGEDVETEDAGEIDFEKLPDIRLDVLLTSENGLVTSEAELRSAIESGKSPIILGAGFEVKQGFDINYGLILYLNGYTLTYSGTSALFNVTSSGDLTIRDVFSGDVGETTASIGLFGGNRAGAWGGKTILSGKQTTLPHANLMETLGTMGPLPIFRENEKPETVRTGGSIEGTVSLDAPIEVKGGTLNMEGGKLSFSNSKHGINANGGNVNIKDGLITGNGKTDQGVGANGGGICCIGGTVKISGGTIEKNKAYARGGGVYVESGSLTITGGTIANNEVFYNGGGVCTDKNTNVTISGGSIEQNKAVNGGGIYMLLGSLTIEEGAAIDKNVAQKLGGGILLNAVGSCTVEGGSISGNKINGEVTEANATKKDNDMFGGGGIYAMGSSAQIHILGGNISNNTIEGTISASTVTGMRTGGGGIFMDVASGKLTISGGNISGNKVAVKLTSSAKEIPVSGGGGVFFRGTMEMTGGSISKNVANTEKTSEREAGGVNHGGGGIFAGGTLNISGGNIFENEAGYSGGGIEVAGKNTANNMYEGSLTMTGGSISNNTANLHEGGGIRIDSIKKNLITGGSITGNKTLTTEDWGGGGIFINSGANLTVENALVTGNSASGYGGGIGGCTTSKVNILTIKGPGIYENTASGSNHPLNPLKPDTIPEEYREVFNKDGKYDDYFGRKESIVFGAMLGGGSANWSGVVDKKAVFMGRDACEKAAEVMALKAEPSATDKAAAKNLAKVTISGNTSNTNGGGIMCNGTLTMGEGGEVGSWSLPAHKSFTDNDNQKIELEGGEFEFYLLNNNPVKDGKVVIDERDLAAPVAKNDENGYVLFIPSFIPSEEEDGEYTYYMVEKAGNKENIIYDECVYEVIVKLEHVKVTVEGKTLSVLNATISNINLVFPKDGKKNVTGNIITFSNTRNSEEPTPTPTPTATPTTSPTATPTTSPTASPTKTPDDENPSKTPDPVPTGTPAITPGTTPTGSPGVTPTGTPTGSSEATPTASATRSPGATPSTMPTGSPGATPSATATRSPGVTPTGIPTGSPRVTPTGTPTGSPGVTPTASATRSPGATPSTTPTGSPGATPSATATSSPGVTPSATPTGSPGATPSATPTGSPGVTTSPGTTPTVSPTASPTDSGRITPTATPTATASPGATTTPGVTTSPEATATPGATTSPQATTTPGATTSPEATTTPGATTSPEATTTPGATTSPEATTTPEATTSPEATTTPGVTTSPEATATPGVTTSPEATATPGGEATPETTPTPDPRMPDSPDIITIDDEGVPRTYVKIWDSEEEDWTYIPEDDVPRALPDPNDAGSPDKITILDDEGVPKTYIKVEDPEDPEGDEFVYILDDGVPLGAPETADASTILLWGGLCLVFMQGIITFWPRKRRHKDGR